MAKIIDARSTPTQQYATTFSYDPATFTTTVTDPAGRTTTYVHNPSGNLVQLTDGAGNVVTQTWVNNELVKVADANGDTTASYDTQGNLLQMTDKISPTDAASIQLGYDAKNNPVSLIDPNGNKSVARYDEVSNQLSEASASRLEADGKTYDVYGNVTSFTDLGAATYNLVENGSFENLDASGMPVGWVPHGATTAISVDQTVARTCPGSVDTSRLGVRS